MFLRTRMVAVRKTYNRLLVSEIVRFLVFVAFFSARKRWAIRKYFVILQRYCEILQHA